MYINHATYRLVFTIVNSLTLYLAFIDSLRSRVEMKTLTFPCFQACIDNMSAYIENVYIEPTTMIFGSMARGGIRCSQACDLVFETYWIPIIRLA